MAVLVSFSVFHAIGIPIDIVSLAGLALATGLLVDNSIVVLESIATARASGSRNAVVDGTRQIVLAVVASSLTLVVVFAPLLYLRGLARAVFGEQAVAVVASVSASLLLSLTLTLVLAKRAGVADTARNPGLRRYLRFLDALAARPRRAFAFALAVTAAAIAAGWLLHGAVRPGRRALRRHGVGPRRPGRRGGVARAGGARLGPRARGGGSGERRRRRPGRAGGRPPCGDRDRTARRGTGARAGGVIAAGRRDAPGDPGRSGRAAEHIRGSDQRRGGSGRARRLCADRARGSIARGARSRGGTPPRARPVDQPRRAARTALQIQWDEARLASLGIARRSADEDVKAALGHLDVGRSDIEGAEPAIRLLPTAPAELEVIPVRGGARVVPVRAVATVRIAENEPVIDHDEGRPAHKLLFRGEAGDWSAFPLSARERLRVAGHAAELDAAYAQMRLAALLAVILLDLTVAAFYESLVLPLLVMAAIPFAAGGGLLSLFLTGQSLNIMSIIGLIFLGGVVVNHSGSPRSRGAAAPRGRRRGRRTLAGRGRPLPARDDDDDHGDSRDAPAGAPGRRGRRVAPPDRHRGHRRADHRHGGDAAAHPARAPRGVRRARRACGESARDSRGRAGAA